ncbi:ATP synthase F1 subunit delta [Mycoplasma sp. Mirounga ES2805-ORL]|uniref:ATP synthase F1 subunit delta n=1 Tax=Mycoplasma sp. Mirounga ES2805-ORL TaxID=754514 RepID=UPI00197C503B|nr:ATP synthase F1 subunit delta [Mycoplasma sp. Mirounga ES2805-ORL]QSF13833.1 ATP synthase F1 subunit delta [Mycoplasma sp. Mirounga ES2805-ORL]
MYSKANAESYALALFELSKESNNVLQMHKLASGLFNAIKNEYKLINIISNTEISKEKRFIYIEKIFNDIKDSELLVKFIKILIEQNLTHILNRILIQFLKLSNEELHIKYAKIYTAFELSSTKLEKIKQKLEKKFNCKIDLHHIIKKELISGFRIEIESLIIENSIDSDLKKLEFLITKKEL